MSDTRNRTGAKFEVAFDTRDIEEMRLEAYSRGLSLEVYVIEGVLDSIRRVLQGVEVQEAYQRQAHTMEKLYKGDQAPGAAGSQAHWDKIRLQRERRRDRLRRLKEYQDAHPNMSSSERIEAGKRFKVL